MKAPSFGARLLVSLSYLSIFFVVPLVFVEEDDSFGAYHVRHGFMIFIVTVLANVLFLALDVITYGYASRYLGRLFNILIVVVCLYGIVSVMRGKTNRLIGISNLLEVFPI
jgi:hypothetical protein